MALRKMRATTIALPADMDRLLTLAAKDRGVSRSELIRRQLSFILEQYRPHPKPTSAGIARRLKERGDESELYQHSRK